MISIKRAVELVLIVISVAVAVSACVSAKKDNTIIQYKLPKDKFPQSEYIDFNKITKVEESLQQAIEKKPEIEDEKERLIKFFDLFIEEDNKNEKQLYQRYRNAYETYVTNTKKLNNLIQKLYTYNKESALLKQLRTELNNGDQELFAESKAADKVEPIIKNVHKQTLEDIQEIEEEIRQLRGARPKIREEYSESIVQYKDDVQRRHKYLRHAGKVVDSFVEQYKQFIPIYDNHKTSEKELSERDNENARCSSKSQECHRELRVYSREVLSGKATLAKREKQLSTDCPESYTEKQKDDDCPMGQKLVRTFKKYKWKYCPYHTCKPIKCPQNWLDLEDAPCPVGKRRKPVKRSYYNGRKKCDYFVCKEPKNVRGTATRHTCRATGDPHYRSFSGRRFNFYGNGDYLFALSKGHNLRVDTRLRRCGWGRQTCNHKVAVRLNEERTFTITVDRHHHCVAVEKETGNRISNGERVNLPNGGYFIVYGHTRRFKAASKDGAYTWGVCGRPRGKPMIHMYANSNGVRFTHGLCVRRSDHRINVKGLLSDTPMQHTNLKGHNHHWKNKARKKKAYRLCKQLQDDFLERDCVFDIKEMEGSPEEIFSSYKDFIDTLKEQEE